MLMEPMSFLGKEQLDWLWREDSENLEADKTDVRRCMAEKKSLVC